MLRSAMAEPSAQQAPTPSGSAVFVPESLQERVDIGLGLKKAVFEAYRASEFEAHALLCLQPAPAAGGRSCRLRAHMPTPWRARHALS